MYGRKKLAPSFFSYFYHPPKATALVSHPLPKSHRSNPEITPISNPESMPRVQLLTGTPRQSLWHPRNKNASKNAVELHEKRRSLSFRVSKIRVGGMVQLHTGTGSIVQQQGTYCDTLFFLAWHLSFGWVSSNVMKIRYMYFSYSS